MKKRNYEQLILYMINEKKSIREISKMSRIPKSTLHYNFTRLIQSMNVDLQNSYNELISDNLSKMASKGGKSHGKWKRREKKNDVDKKSI